MDEAGELLGAVQESLSDLSLSDASSVNALMQDMAELLLFIPTVAEGVRNQWKNLFAYLHNTKKLFTRSAGEVAKFLLLH